VFNSTVLDVAVGIIAYLPRDWSVQGRVHRSSDLGLASCRQQSSKDFTTNEQGEPRRTAILILVLPDRVL
jgi:hypothetical protein